VAKWLGGELFEGRRDNRQHRERWIRPQVVLA
jgi:hypothetical protein